MIIIYGSFLNFKVRQQMEVKSRKKGKTAALLRDGQGCVGW